ncbi:MAG: hypothetical protein Q4F84_05660 [Fibrobacter sp.]|nr:hypothetical protein [Fibrobacter sp.]
MKKSDLFAVIFGVSMTCMVLLCCTCAIAKLNVVEARRVDGYCDLSAHGGCVERGCKQFFENSGRCISGSGGCDCVK